MTIADLMLRLRALLLRRRVDDELQAFDPLAYLAGTLVVVAACLTASFFPALRAARLDPMTTLRAD